MENKKIYALMLTQDSIAGEVIEKCLREAGYSIIKSSSINDALLKSENQDFDFICIDMDSAGLESRQFVAIIRKKEAKKNIREKSHILVCASVASVFNRYFAHFDNVKFCEMPIREVELKKKIESFSSRTDASYDNTKTILKGELLISEGGIGQEMFWVLEGSFDILKTSPAGETTVVGQVNSGELVGEMSFLDELPRSASIRAQVDSEVLSIPQAKFADVLDKQPRWFRSLMKTLSQRLRDANKRITDKDE
jgi:CRP/FNR family cyclic AMP-dependent transcriptional regulator